MAAAVLLLAFNLAMALLMWKLTVRSAILKISATSLEVLPSAVQRSTSTSRLESVTSASGSSLAVKATRHAEVRRLRQPTHLRGLGAQLAG